VIDVDGHYFVSYSRHDGGAFVATLADRLLAGVPPYRLWVDVDPDDMHPGRDWDDQIVEAIQTCRAVLFVMTTDSVRTGSGCKPEWVWALSYKKPVIPLRCKWSNYVAQSGRALWRNRGSAAFARLPCRPVSCDNREATGRLRQIIRSNYAK
jgi:hypothetical protein